MATKAKKKPAPKKAPAAVLSSKPSATLSAFTPDLSALTKGFAPFQKLQQFPQFPQFQPFKMETTMFTGNKQIEKITQDATTAAQSQVDALVKSSTIFAKGMEDIIKTCMEIAQAAGEKNQNLAKTMMSCKTLNEFTDVQTKVAQASFDEFMTNATKISEKGVKLCSDCMEPINDQMGKAMKRAKDSIAA